MPYKDRAKRLAYAKSYYARPEIKAAYAARAMRPDVRTKRLAREAAIYATPEGKARSQRRKGLPAATRPTPSSCECCGALAKLHLDHDHVTGKFRGWICSKCNTGLGLLGDSILALRRALKYLAFNS